MSDRKITFEDAETIRLFYHVYGYSQRELADVWELSRASVRRILNEETYRPTTPTLIRPAKDTSNDKADQLLEGVDIRIDDEVKGKNWPQTRRHYDLRPESDASWLWTLVALLTAVGLTLGVGFALSNALGLM